MTSQRPRANSRPLFVKVRFFTKHCVFLLVSKLKYKQTLTFS